MVKNEHTLHGFGGMTRFFPDELLGIFLWLMIVAEIGL